MSSRFIPNLNWLDGNGKDLMHTSYQGTVKREIALSVFVFIRVRRYFSRLELNEEKKSYGGWRPGQYVPNFGAYIEDGVAGTLPKPAAAAKFTASQCKYISALMSLHVTCLLPACYLHVTYSCTATCSGIGLSTVQSSWSNYSVERYCSTVLASALSPNN